MYTDFLGLKVIWPPDGTRPPRHEHDIVFVHDLQNGPVSAWQDETGVCWPAEHLSLDLETTRVLAYGYNPKETNVRSDGLFRGGLLFNQGLELWTALKAFARKSNEVQVPLTFVGHGTGGIMIKSALCISHLKDEDMDLTLRKTKHVMFLNTPNFKLTWDIWKQVSEGSPSARSEGQWKVWSAAQENTSKYFREIAGRFNVTSVIATDGDLAGLYKSTFIDLDHEVKVFCEGVNHRTISKLSKDSVNYRKLLDRIRLSMKPIVHDHNQIQRVRSWLGRRFDQINQNSCNKSLREHHTGTGRWLFEKARFREWIDLEGKSPVLWLTGPEGCGKSVLCSVAAERIRHSNQQPSVIQIALAFDQHRSEYYLTVQLALQLLNHVTKHCGGVDTEVLSLLPEHIESGKKVSKVQELVKVLISQCPSVFVFIDGLDEITEADNATEQQGKEENLRGASKHLHSTLLFLVNLTKSKEGTSIRLWCSSRQTSTITEWMKEFSALELSVDRHAIKTDVASYLDHQFRKGTSSTDVETALENLMDRLRETIGNDFLFASMVTKQLQDSDLSSEIRIRAVTERIPKSKFEMVENKWDHLHRPTSLLLDENERSRLLSLRHIVSFVAFAKRPLKLSELQEALSIIQPSSIHILNGDEIKREGAPFLEYYLPEEQSGDGYFRLSHAYFHNFMRKRSQDPIQMDGEVQIGPHVIADACLKYLSQERYDDMRMNSVPDHHFLNYAAKYWHRHVDEAAPHMFLLQSSSDLMRSRQFLTITRLQSLRLHRHFHRSLTDKERLLSPETSRINVPRSLEGQDSASYLIDDYRNFIGEWSHFLEQGTTTSNLCGQIEQCFWGALGERNHFHRNGSLIEENSSFLLEFDTSDKNLTLEEKDTSRTFYESISDDGHRIAVWKLPTRDHYSSSDHSPLLRESWYLDGHNPPFRYSSQEVISLDTKKAQFHFYDSSPNRNYALIPTSDSLPQVPALHEFSLDSAARIGRSLFRRESGGTWRVDDTSSGNVQWDSIICRGQWVVRSCRKYVDPAVKDQDLSSQPVEKQPSTSAEPTKSGSRKPLTQTNTQNEEENDGDENTDDEKAAVQEIKSESESQSSDEESSSEHEVLVSSADEYCVAGHSDSDLSDDSSEIDPWLSPDEDDSESGRSDDDNQSIASSESTSSIASDISTKHRLKRTRVSQQKSRNMDSTGDSDADDENSGSESEDDNGSKPNERPLHQFSMSRFCDLCMYAVVPYNLEGMGLKEATFHQCSPCGGRAGDSYDICSNCFNKGKWCKDPNHLLSKGLVKFRERKVFWEDRISQHTAPPLVKIVAECNRDPSSAAEDFSTTICFRYTRRQATMLHDSQPIIHPTLPLVVYPLDGSQLLFGNLNDNTYFTYDIPFQLSETAETSGSKCIPISVSLRFSSCGKFIHLVRFTARKDGSFHGNNRLRALSVTIALSSIDACSGKPDLLPTAQGFDLGQGSILVKSLPYAVTWTDSEVYVAMSSDVLRVWRIRLYTDAHAIPENRVHIFSREIPLPRSARLRTVKFFPTKENVPARLILGSLREDAPQPPAVVYLKSKGTDEWIAVGDNDIESPLDSLRLRDDPLIEEPCIDDDDDLLVEKHGPEKAVTIEPLVPFRRWLETGFQTRGIYCPSCFELSLKLNFLRPPPYIPFYFLDADVPEFTKYKIDWKVKPEVLIEALKAGCQFCCYVAVRLFSFHHIRQTSLFLGSESTRCCAKGATTKKTEDIQKVIDNLGRLEWQVGPEQQKIIFQCEPLGQDMKTRSFDKLAITIPSLTTGKKGSTAFAPVMVVIHGEKEGVHRTVTSFFHSGETSHGTPECVLELYALPASPAHELIETRPLATDRGGDENLTVINSWLKECQSSHSFCQQSNNLEVPLPTRLLEIADASTVNLIETKGQVGQYVALSYCWGPEPRKNSMTTAANIKDRLQSRSLRRSELPAAIADAITITESLGLKHIWVDALCMIQDSLEDKHGELSNMSKYYRNSYLTIAASTQSCTTGFIGMIGRCEEHPDFELPSDLVPLQVFAMAREEDKGQQDTIYVREENPYQLFHEPINLRAWTMQEMLLAPRVLMFGSRVMWFCQHMTHSDGGVEDWSFDDNEMERTRREFQIALSKLDRNGRHDDEEGSLEKKQHDNRDMYNLWHRIVGTYSQRALTHPIDKFPAISAIAAEFARLTKDDYIAGLWRSNLLRDMLWTTPNPETHRPETWRAPTWSWASVDDEIYYDHLPPEHATQLAKVVTAEAVPLASMVPFGEIEQGRLIITAPCVRLNMAKAEEPQTISKLLLKDFGFKAGKSEREFLLEALRSRSSIGRKELGGGGEKKEYQLPDEIVMAFFYGVCDELVRSNDGDAVSKSQDWEMWGLALKPTAGASGEKQFERVMLFSRILIHFEDFDKFLSGQETLHVI